MSNIFCGIGDLAKGDRYGTMRECLEKGQVRRFGVHKIDTRTISKIKEDIAESKTVAEKIVDYENQISALRAKHGKLVKKIKEETDAKEKALLKKQDAETIKEHNQLTDEMKKLKSKQDSKRSSKRRSKIRSKRRSKRLSKKRSKKHSRKSRRSKRHSK